jgi:general secretion pathway protein D
MRFCVRIAAFWLLLMVVAFAADSPGALFKKGQDAEARQDYEAAYDFYKQAWDLKPKDIRYRTSAQRTRLLASSSYVHRGYKARDEGKLEDALALFEKAAQIDPSNFIANQEIRKTLAMIRDARTMPTPRSVAEPSIPSGLANVGGPVELAPISDQPITVKLTEDSKVIYETIGKLAGVNVLFDPDYTARRIKVELTNVSLAEALQLVALESKTFWRPVTPNTIFVAADTAAKRRELEQSVVRTFYLSNLSAPTELQDIVNAIRQILQVTRVQPIPTQMAVVVRGTPDQVAMAEKIIYDIDKAKPEVVVEVAVMQVRRDKLRELGISPPTNTSIALAPTTTGTGTGATTTTNTINLNRLGNLKATDFNVTIPPATASFLLNDSTTRIIQNPQIRALHGQKATLKIGDRVPVATGSFQPGIGGVGINPLVNTQFQYIDVGVNLDITPQVHAGREITLKVLLDVSSVTSRVNIGGIDQPVIGQRRVEHDIRLKEGEVNILGGILEQQDAKALSGIPGLAQIPILRYLFSSERTERQENEIVFVLVPHLVRGQELTELNTRAVDVGREGAIDLRRTTPAAPAAAPTPGGGAPRPTAAAPDARPPMSEGATMRFEPGTSTQAAGSTFAVNIFMTSVEPIHGAPIVVQYDPNILQLVNVSNGDFLSRDGAVVTLVHSDNPAGTLRIQAARPPQASGMSGQGTLYTLTFMAKAAGTSNLTITRPGARNPAMQAVPVTASNAVVTVR